MFRWRKIFTLLPALAALLLLTAGDATALLKDVGPVNLSNGFPVWYRDSSSNLPGYPQGLPLEQCLSKTVSPFVPQAGDFPSYMCNLLPEFVDPDNPAAGLIFDPRNPIVFPTNFPEEIFWWSGDAGIAPGDPGNQIGVDATLVLGLEGAFGVGPVQPGDQVSFARVRIRVDIPAGKAGNYRITHPYGVDTFTINNPANNRDINFTQDLGLGAPGQFGGALGGRLGPFLVWTPDAGPATPTNADGTISVVTANGTEVFVGDPNVPHTVTGSPFNTNFFRVERLDSNGNVIESSQTNLFSVTGKIYTTPIPTPLEVKRAVYSRSSNLTVFDVFATAGKFSNQAIPTLSALQVTDGQTITQNMLSDGEGNFYLHYELPQGAELPSTLTVTNTADNQPIPATVSLVDDVAITAALYDPAAKTLSIQATSSDTVTPPSIVVPPFGALVSGSLTVSNVEVPPPAITASSSIGGSDTEPVRISIPGLVQPVTGVTLSATANPPQSPGTQITLIATATGGSGSYEYRFWLYNATTTEWSVLRDYAGSAFVTWNTTGLGAGDYTIAVDVRNAGSAVYRDTVAYLSYTLGAPVIPFNNVTIVAEPPNSGTPPVTITATATGGNGTPEYRFWLYNAALASWSEVQPYSTDATWEIPIGTLAGNYVIAVDARNVNSAVYRDTVSYMNYTVE